MADTERKTDAEVEILDTTLRDGAQGEGLDYSLSDKRKIAMVLEKLGVDDPIFDVARELEQIALKDPYFVDKKLYPNVDFYSGIILSAIGFPTSMFTVLFALARTVGWVAQWNEMIGDPEQKIGRPRQLYTGAPQRDYVPISQR